MNISDKAHELLDEGNIEASIALVSKELAKLPKTSFHSILELEFTNSQLALGNKINAFINKHRCQAIYIEYNNDWDFDIFGFDKCGDKSFLWLGDFSYEVEGDPLLGMESIKGESIYPPYPLHKNYNSDQIKAREICINLITLKFYKLIYKSLTYISNLDIPVIVCSHDDDSFGVFGSTSKMLDYDPKYHEQIQQESIAREKQRALENQNEIDAFNQQLLNEEFFCLGKAFHSMKFPNDIICPNIFIKGCSIKSTQMNRIIELEVTSIDHFLDYKILDEKFREFGVPVVSKPIADILKKHCLNDIELIPVTLICETKHHHTHFIVNVTSVIKSSIDIEKSKIKWASNTTPFSQNSALQFWPLKLLPGCMGKMSIGRLYEDMRKILISNKLANALHTFQKSENIDRRSIFNDLVEPLDTAINKRYYEDLNGRSPGRYAPSWAK